MRLLRNQLGVNLEAADNDGHTPLHQAAAEGHEDCLNALLFRKVNINAVDNYGRTALHWAAAFGEDRCLYLLLKPGANISAADRDGWTALDVATARGHEACVKTLQAALSGAPPTVQAASGLAGAAAAAQTGELPSACSMHCS